MFCQSILSGKNKKKGTPPGGGKLVDLVALRTKYSIKLSSVTKFAVTALNEAVKKYRNFVDNEESDFYGRFQGHSLGGISTSVHVCSISIRIFVSLRFPRFFFTHH